MARITASAARDLTHKIPLVWLALGVVLERDIVEQELPRIVDSLQLLEDVSAVLRECEVHVSAGVLDNVVPAHGDVPSCSVAGSLVF